MQTYFSLNETGSCIWQLMERGLALGEIAQGIEARYKVSPDRARQCVLELASELAAEKLVSLTDGSETVSLEGGGAR
jgi:hypothetical protein